MASLAEIRQFMDFELTDLSEQRRRRKGPYTLAWVDIQATALPPRERCWDKLKRLRVKDVAPPKPKTILHGVSGLSEPGRILAIMGSSGSGKTTLLNVLSGRRHLQGNLFIEGSVTANGNPVTAAFCKRNIAYVEQVDLFINAITAREHLNFHAILRMDADTSPRVREEKINKALIQLGLGDVSESPIKDLSGGEKKRLSFATELLTEPYIMLCDEPTCGLDSFMADNVMRTLKGLAAQGKTIITTVHQPPSAMYDLFDEIFLMVDGKCAFMGPSNHAIQYFAERGFLCPYTFSPPDFFILLLSVVPDQEEICKQRIQRAGENKDNVDATITRYVQVHVLLRDQNNIASWIARHLATQRARTMDYDGITDSYENSVIRADLDGKIQFLTSTDVPVEEESELKAVLSSYKSSWWTQFALLLRRSCRSVIRDQASLKTRIPAHILAGLFFGLCYFDQRSSETVQNITGYLALMLILLASETVFSVVQILPHEVPVFLREHHTGMYNTAAYFFSRVLAEIPSIFICKGLYILVSYWLVGLSPDFGRFLGCCVVTLLTSGVGFAFGMFVSMTNDNITVVLAIAQSILLPMIIVGGFFIKPESIPWYMYWLKYTSWFYYGYELLNINEWNGRAELDCSSAHKPNCTTSGELVLKALGYSTDNVLADTMALICLFFGYLFLGYLTLLYRVSSRYCMPARCSR